MITLQELFKFSEDLYDNERNHFCSICIFRHDPDCIRCDGWDFHKEFVDIKAARNYINEYVYPYKNKGADLI